MIILLLAFGIAFGQSSADDEDTLDVKKETAAETVSPEPTAESARGKTEDKESFDLGDFIETIFRSGTESHDEEVESSREKSAAQPNTKSTSRSSSTTIERRNPQTRERDVFIDEDDNGIDDRRQGTSGSSESRRSR